MHACPIHRGWHFFPQVTLRRLLHHIALSLQLRLERSFDVGMGHFVRIHQAAVGILDKLSILRFKKLDQLSSCCIGCNFPHISSMAIQDAEYSDTFRLPFDLGCRPKKEVVLVFPPTTNVCVGAYLFVKPKKGRGRGRRREACHLKKLTVVPTPTVKSPTRSNLFELFCDAEWTWAYTASTSYIINLSHRRIRF